MHKDTGVI